MALSLAIPEVLTTEMTLKSLTSNLRPGYFKYFEYIEHVSTNEVPESQVGWDQSACSTFTFPTWVWSIYLKATYIQKMYF